MSDFIPAGAKLVCPSCGRLQLFQRAIPEEALPLVIKCSTPECGYQLSYTKTDSHPLFPKVDPINRVQGNWLAEIQQAESKERWAPLAGQRSFREHCNTIATHVAGALQTIKVLESTLDQLAAAVTNQFESEWGKYSGFLRLWNPGRVDNWIKQPFVSFPVPCQDRFLLDRTRLFLHPNFFVPRAGFPLKAYGGFNAQLITPYTLFHFPLETWLQKLLAITPVPDIKVVADRIVGRDLVKCWRDIPGTVRDIEHHDDAPLLRIRDSKAARPWLARLGISPWQIGMLTEEHAYKQLWTYYLSDTQKLYQTDTFHRFKEHGRLALFFEQIVDAWEIALTIGAFMYGQKLVLLPSLEHKEKYSAIFPSGLVKANTTFHWKLVQGESDLDGIPWEQISYVIVDYSEEFPPEALHRLYQYNGRLIIIAQNMLMDTLETNWEAAHFHGLVARSIWNPDLPALNADFNYTKSQDNLVAGILANWHDDARITTGRPPA